MLIDKFGDKITTSELLAGILALVPDRGRIAGKEKLHTLFYELRLHHDILKEFYGFDTRWPQVWSEKLDEAFRWLSVSRTIKKDGEFYAFGITQDATDIVKEKTSSPQYGLFFPKTFQYSQEYWNVGFSDSREFENRASAVDFTRSTC